MIIPAGPYTQFYGDEMHRTFATRSLCLPVSSLRIISELKSSLSRSLGEMDRLLHRVRGC